MPLFLNTTAKGEPAHFELILAIFAGSESQVIFHIATMKNKMKKMKKLRLLDLKDDLLQSTNQLCKVFDALNEKDGLTLLNKINSFVAKTKKHERKKSTEFTVPIPSAKPTNPMDFNKEEFDAYEPRVKATDSSHSEPFSSNYDSEDEGDDLNNAINMGVEEYSEDSIVRKIRIRDRFGDEDDFLTDKSIVTKQNLNIPRRVDPFKDAGKIIGRFPYQENSYSTVPVETRLNVPIKRYSDAVAENLNKDDYDSKYKWRKAELNKIGLDKNKLELKRPNEADLKERERLNNEYKRYLIDLERRALKVPEPNMINTTNGECSEEWRKWFQNRMEQMECWLVEDAINYHLPPSMECDPPAGLSLLAVDWNVFRKSEVDVIWDYTTHGPLVLSEDMVYDGKSLYDPRNGRTWSNIVEHLEDQVKKRWLIRFPDSNRNPFNDNGGLFWCHILQQWYDLVNVSTPIYILN